MTETFDLEGVCKLEEVIEVRLLDFNFTPVHKEQEITDYFFTGIFENDDGMFFRQIFEQSDEKIKARSSKFFENTGNMRHQISLVEGIF